MPSLDRFVNYACGSINFDNTTLTKMNLLESFVNFCDSYSRITRYYLIAHDDTDILHIHFIFYSQSQTRLLTYFNKMRDWFVSKEKLIRNEGGINLMKCESINAHLRYFLHIDDKSRKEGKQEYVLSDIISNDEYNIIEGIINSRKGEFDAYYLRDCVLDYPDDFDLMNKLGLKNFHKYRYEIEILKENRIRLVQQRENERKERIKEDEENIKLNGVSKDELPF